MLTVRSTQLKVLNQAALRGFEGEMLEHLKGFAPKHCEVIGESASRQLLHLGIERASQYGFTKRGPVRLYIELMIQLGSNFDTDPIVEWAGNILTSGTEENQALTAERLYQRELEYVEATIGRYYRYEREAIQRVQELSFTNVLASSVNSDSEMSSRLRALYPQKFDYIGESAIRSLVQQSRELVHTNGLAANPGVLVLAGCLFAFGHALAVDPQFPWFKKALMSSSGADPLVRVEAIFNRLKIYLANALATIPNE